MKRSIFIVLLLSRLAFAGGPLNVAGVSGFQPGLSGTPITWANGQIFYYTDRGNLSPILSGSDTDELVADAFSRWTSVSTAALSATRFGPLDEDVNGTNVWSYHGDLTIPNDLLPDSGKPLAIVYDADGRVFDALLGTGAGSAQMCNTNSVYGTINRITDDAHFVHALIFINGNCVTSASQVPLLRYQLIRVIGQVLGLDYSQLNDNIFTGSPAPTLEDYAGYPTMHPLGLLCTDRSCQSDADQLRMDDRAAISQLYPITTANVADYPGKQVFADTTVRISGSVRFGSVNGSPGQGMQGANVVARLVDPATGLVSRRYTSSSVSGFLFRGNAGNPVRGFRDALGRPLDSSGSDDTALEGFFDLAGLEVPAGYSQATYELSVEPVNPLYSGSTSVGPYKGGPVAISGTFGRLRITVPRGGSTVQDIAMQGVPKDAQDQFEPSSFASGATLPSGGDWFASLSGYGDRDYYSFNARANRTFTFDATALDENQVPVATKSQPVIGFWSSTDEELNPRSGQNFFNSAETGKTRIQYSTITGGEYKLGVMDARGDGRPDFLYEARLLYADDIAPARSGVKGGTAIAVSGTGFSSNVQVQIGGVVVSPNVVAADRLVFSAPPLPDGNYSIAIIDPSNGAFAQMDNILQVGGAGARLVLLSGSNPQVPVGTQAPNPMRVQVVDLNTGEPVVGATVQFVIPSSVAIVGCPQPTCTLYSDQTGVVNAYMVVKAAGASVVSAWLPTGNTVSTTVNGVNALLDIILTTPTFNVSSGSNATVTAQAMVVANGMPVPNKSVNFLLNSGTATIGPVTAVTGGDGMATSSITVSAISKDVNISACVAPGNMPCRTLIIHPVASTALSVQRIGGDQQMINVGESFAPVTIRVVDASANPVAGVPVTFMVDVYRTGSDIVRTERGDLVVSTQDEVVILSTSWTKTTSDASGLAILNLGITPTQPVRVIVRAVAGVSETIVSLQSIWNSFGNSTAGAALSRADQAAVSVRETIPFKPPIRPLLLFSVPEVEAIPTLPADEKEKPCKDADSRSADRHSCAEPTRTRVEKPRVTQPVE